MEHDGEHIDGVLVERNPRTPVQSALAAIAGGYLNELRNRFGYALLPRCNTQTVEKSRYRTPDILLCSRPIPKGKALTTVPWVVIEILSPDDRLSNILERFREYASIGVPEIVLLDPETRVARRFENDSLLKVHLTALPLPNGQSVPFDSDAMFRELTDELS